jgi:hypothetical protein
MAVSVHEQFLPGEVMDLELDAIKLAPENEMLYAPITPSRHDIVALSKSLQSEGQIEELVVTRDGYLLSGHRRLAAMRRLGWVTARVRVDDLSRDEDPDAFLRRLAAANHQRVKTLEEAAREVAVQVDPAEAVRGVMKYRLRRSRAKLNADAVHIGASQRRSEISAARAPFLQAVQRILEEQRDYWPLSDRQVHYRLLNDPPLIHASKPDSRYSNDRRSYRALTDLLTRARIGGLIPMFSIGDATRPVDVWQTFLSSADFLRSEMEDLFKGYWRDLMASQPNHIEIVLEKMTALSVIRPIAGEFTIPLTCSRGFASLSPRAHIHDRFRKSGKDKLVVLVLSDFDPDGDAICQSIGDSLHGDFGLRDDQIHLVKAALTQAQVAELNLPANLLEAKKGSPNYGRFVRRYGSRGVYELEAVAPEALKNLLRRAIESVLDRKRYAQEQETEQQEIAFLAQQRATICRMLALGQKHASEEGDADD